MMTTRPREDRFRKEVCDVGRPVPMNRTDLLIPRNPPSYATYYRPPKYPKPLPRPSTAMDMINNIEQNGYVGEDLEAIYTIAVTNPPSVNNAILARQNSETNIAITQFRNRSNNSTAVPVVPTMSGPDPVSTQFVNRAIATNTIVALGQPSLLQLQQNLDRVRAKHINLQQQYQNLMNEMPSQPSTPVDSGDELNLQEGMEASFNMPQPTTPATPTVRRSSDRDISTPSLSGNISPAHYGRLLAPGRYTRANYTTRTPRAEGGGSNDPN